MAKISLCPFLWSVVLVMVARCGSRAAGTSPDSDVALVESSQVEPILGVAYELAPGATPTSYSFDGRALFLPDKKVIVGSELEWSENCWGCGIYRVINPNQTIQVNLKDGRWIDMGQLSEDRKTIAIAPSELFYFPRDGYPQSRGRVLRIRSPESDLTPLGDLIGDKVYFCKDFKLPNDDVPFDMYVRSRGDGITGTDSNGTPRLSDYIRSICHYSDGENPSGEDFTFYFGCFDGTTSHIYYRLGEAALSRDKKVLSLFHHNCHQQ